jgi:hypothetical protein
MSQPGGVDVIFMPAADVTTLGTGCGSSATDQPELKLTTPVLGQQTTFSVDHMPSTAGPASVVVSVATTSTTPLGWNCTVYLDLTTLQPLFTLPGSGSLSILLPESGVLAGFSFNAQAFALDNAAPLGLVLTNGLSATLGF